MCRNPFVSTGFRGAFSCARRTVSPARRHVKRLRAAGFLLACECSATARVLAAEGCEVVVPRKQACCGALMLHSGMEDDAAALAKKMIAVFEAADVDTIVINSAGCGSTMKEYGHLLRDDPALGRACGGFLGQVQRHLGDPVRAGTASAAPSAQTARRLSRRLPSAACTGCARTAAPPAGRYSRTRRCRDSRSNALLRIGRRLQSACSPRRRIELGDRKVENLLSTRCPSRRSPPIPAACCNS